jgi:hypothetical protein
MSVLSNKGFATVSQISKTNTVMFSWYEYLVLVAMLVFSTVIGIYFGCFGSKQSTTAEYLFGGQKMKFFPIGLSITVR